MSWPTIQELLTEFSCGIVAVWLVFANDTNFQTLQLILSPNLSNVINEVTLKT